VVEAAKLKVAHFVAKPFDKTVLAEKIKDICQVAK
jgi:hypothetical protein